MDAVELFSTIGLSSIFAAFSIDVFFLVIGSMAIGRQKRENQPNAFPESDFPSLTILIPCYNEENAIKSSINYLKQVDYPGLTIVIIDDGSTDRTFDILRQELSLICCPLDYQPLIATQFINNFYRSACKRFIVVNKVNGGKADSLNVGLNLCHAQLVCCVDADTIIKQDALKKLVVPFIRDLRVVASGGNVRLKNGSDSLDAFPSKLNAPQKLLTTLQVIEYIRSINISRNAFSLFNANLIISGAFGVFKTSILKKIGGYEAFSKGEDIELVTRIHLYMRQKKKTYKISQIYAADAFTDGPESISTLKSQRKRWQLGLVSTLRAHGLKFFRYPLSVITLFSLPYYTLFEVIFPVTQILTYIAVPALVIGGIISWKYFLYLLFIFLYSSIINICYLTVDFRAGYYKKPDQLKLILSSLAEPFFYHQLNCYWKFLGVIDAIKKVFVKASWTPPRGKKSTKSQWGNAANTLIENDSTGEKGLRLYVDYKTLFRQGVIIASLSGIFEISDIEEFEEMATYFEKKKRIRFILEMEHLNNISVGALGCLVRLSEKLKKKGGGIVILAPSAKIEDQLRISNAIKRIKVYKNYSDAITGLKYG